MKKIVDKATDGHTEIEVKDGRQVRVTRVQDTDPYYAQNKLLRNEIGKAAVTRKGGWALPLGQIPFADYQKLIKLNPELSATDPEIRTKAWLNVLRQTKSEIFRTVDRSLVPDSMNPDRGSIILPGATKCHQNLNMDTPMEPATKSKKAELTAKVDKLLKTTSE